MLTKAFNSESSPVLETLRLEQKFCNKLNFWLGYFYFIIMLKTIIYSLCADFQKSKPIFSY